MRYVLLFLVFLCFFGSGFCSDGSDSDPERVPLLSNKQDINNNNNLAYDVQDIRVENHVQLEGVVVDLAGRCPHGILVPRDGIQLTVGLGRDVWLIILSQLEQHDLMSMREVNTFFHRLLTQPGATSLPLGENFLLEIADARFNAGLPNKNMSPYLYALALFDYIQAMQRKLGSPVLLNRYLRLLHPEGRALWRLRYTPGMNRDDLRLLLNALQLSADHSFLSCIEAHQYAALHTSRLKGGLAEAAKASLVFGSTAISLWLMWSKTFQLPESCQTVYAFPARLLLGQAVQVKSADLGGRIGGSIVVSFNLFGYLLTWLRGNAKVCFKFREWGRLPNYEEWVSIMANRDSPLVITSKKICNRFILPVLAAALVITSGASYLDLHLTTVFTGQLTIGQYIHEELKHGLAQNISCCAMAIDSFLGGSCPYVDANKIKNFSELISTAAVVTGYASLDLVNFSVITFQVLFVTVLLFLNFF